MNFGLEWFTFYLAIMFAMSVDNIFWIPTSPEYKQFKKVPWIRTDKKGFNYAGGYYANKLEYIIFYRIKSVLFHWRDIVPAIITSFILAVVL